MSGYNSASAGRRGLATTQTSTSEIPEGSYPRRRAANPLHARARNPRAVKSEGIGLAGWWASAALVLALACPVFQLGLRGQLGVGLLLLLTIASAKGAANPARVPRVLKLLAAGGVIALVITWRGVSTTYYDLTNYALLLPLTVAAGRRLEPEARKRLFQTFVLLSSIASVLAILEVERQSHFFTGGQFFDTPDRDGQLRARAFFEQPLILSAFATLAAVHVLIDRRARSRFGLVVTTAILFAGIWASGSRSPLVVLACVALVVAARRLIVRLVGGYSLAASGLLLVLLVAIPSILGALDTSNSFVTSSDADLASAQYRAELYRQIFVTLASHPLGFGIGPLPTGVILVESPFGILDVANTVDSEYVLAALKFGIPGLLVWVYVIGLALVEALAQGNARSSAGLRLLGLAVFGAVLALTVWIPVIVLLGLLIGMCLQAGVDPAGEEARK